MAIQYAYRLSIIIFVLVISRAAFDKAVLAPSLIFAFKLMFVSFIAGCGLAEVLRIQLDEMVERDVNLHVTEVYTPLFSEFSPPSNNTGSPQG